MSFFDAFWQPHHRNSLSHSHGLGSLLHYLDESHSKLEENATPDLDVRETSSTYFLDVELPGVTDKKNDLLIQWASSRTLVIEGQLRRSDIAREWGEHSKQLDSKSSVDVHEEHHDPKQEPKPEQPNLIFKERSVGKFRRSFTFPVDIESTKLRAKLEDGLLKIMVPKQKHDDRSGQIVSIE
jgi:HSP20 family molecular chaperone IbpA